MTFKPGYICTECAEGNGCTWPEEHMATWHEGTCDFCELTADVCHSTDWGWPDKTMQPEEREI